MRVLVTGGAGYIGAHACVALQAAGHTVTVLDNLCASDGSALDGIAAISGLRPVFVRGDVRDRALLLQVLREQGIEAVLHFAALKDVEESCRQPQVYFDNNVGGTGVLLAAMDETGIERLVFSSSAAVYGHAGGAPIAESVPLAPASPYGRSKLHCEQLVAEAAAARPGLRAVVLRYFNPVGAHPSGLLGERADAGGLLARLLQVASGQREYLTVFGSDYPTIDGTGVRDFVHVVDIAHAHVCALDRLVDAGGITTVNLGTGRAASVLQLVAAFEHASGRSIPLRYAPRRGGDVAFSQADPTRAKLLLGWQAELGIGRICEDAWRRQDLVAQAMDVH